MNKVITILSLMLLITVAHAGMAQALTMDIYAIEGDDYSADYTLEVSESLGGGVSFTFSTVSGASGYIAQIYLYESTDSLLDTTHSYISNAPGTWASFSSSSVSPPNLPGINGTSYSGYDKEYAAGKRPGYGKGIDAGESVTFTLWFDGLSYDDVVALLNDGSVVLGFHAQSQGFNETSSAYLTTATPIPGSILLLGSGLFGLGFFRKKKSS